MKHIYFILFVIVLFIFTDFVLWDFPVYFSLSFYLKIVVLVGLTYIGHSEIALAESGSTNLKFGYISEMIFLLFFSLWFALLHHINVDYLSKASGFGFIVAAFAMFSLIVVFVEKLMNGDIWHKLTLLSMKISMYVLLVLGGYLLVFGEWRWELIFIFDLF